MVGGRWGRRMLVLFTFLLSLFHSSAFFLLFHLSTFSLLSLIPQRSPPLFSFLFSYLPFLFFSLSLIPPHTLPSLLSLPPTSLTQTSTNIFNTFSSLSNTSSSSSSNTILPSLSLLLRHLPLLISSLPSAVSYRAVRLALVPSPRPASRELWGGRGCGRLLPPPIPCVHVPHSPSCSPSPGWCGAVGKGGVKNR